jgi:hypothetical protein
MSVESFVSPDASHCMAWVVLALLLLGGSALTMTFPADRLAPLRDDPTLSAAYTRVARQRQQHYWIGLLLGLVGAAVLLRFVPQAFPGTAARVAGAVGVTLLVAVVVYSVLPKSEYVLQSIQTPTQIRAWLDVYRGMKSRYMWGALLGIAVAIPLAMVVCR